MTGRKTQREVLPRRCGMGVSLLGVFPRGCTWLIAQHESQVAKWIEGCESPACHYKLKM